MDLNLEYAAHQQAMMKAAAAASIVERVAQLRRASSIADRISAFQEKLGAAAAASWGTAQRLPFGQR